jgi:hypothetical protein
MLWGEQEVEIGFPQSEKGEAFADKNPHFTDKFGRKCFAPTAKNRLLQEVYCLTWSSLSRFEKENDRLFKLPP